MNGVDFHDQMCMKYDVGHFLVKAWKYMLWYFVNTSIVNAYTFYCKTSTRQTKKKYIHLDFEHQLQWHWLLDFHQEKGRQKPQYFGSVTAANENNPENVYMGSKKGKRCKLHCKQQMRKETVYGFAFAMYTCVKMDAILPTITNNIKVLINFFYFETSIDISQKLFMSMVRLIWQSYKKLPGLFISTLWHMPSGLFWLMQRIIISKTKTITPTNF